MEKEITFPGGNLVFDIRDGSARLERAVGNFTIIDIPEVIEGYDGDATVSSIVKKAFLGKKTIKRITVPATVESIGDWAFSGCSNLDEIVIPDCSIGDGVFNGCRSLKDVKHPAMSEDKGRLFAGCIRWEAPPHLSDFEHLGDGWLARFDAWAVSLLESPDDEGFQNQILCGEEDYGSSDRDAYESRRRKMKASVCMERLLNPEGLNDRERDLLSGYIYDHRAGSAAGSESWHALRYEYPDKVHFDLLSDLNCIDDTNRDLMIRELGDDSGELKSLLVKSSGNDASERFFDSLKL